jgi:hypothetical protein
VKRHENDYAIFTELYSWRSAAQLLLNKPSPLGVRREAQFLLRNGRSI